VDGNAVGGGACQCECLQYGHSDHFILNNCGCSGLADGKRYVTFGLNLYYILTSAARVFRAAVNLYPSLATWRMDCPAQPRTVTLKKICPQRSLRW
jgi:hypothetical protein